MSEENNNRPAEEQELSEILRVRRDKLAALQQEGRDPFRQTKFARSAWSSEIKADFAAFEGKTVSVAGRMMSKRGMGKAIFCHIKDDRGTIQLYIRSDAVSEQEFADFRKYDIGDIVAHIRAVIAGIRDDRDLIAIAEVDRGKPVVQAAGLMARQAARLGHHIIAE